MCMPKCLLLYSREVMKTLLKRYKDSLGLTQDQISKVEVNISTALSLSLSWLLPQAPQSFHIIINTWMT